MTQRRRRRSRKPHAGSRRRHAEHASARETAGRAKGPTRLVSAKQAPRGLDASDLKPLFATAHDRLEPRTSSPCWTGSCTFEREFAGGGGGIRTHGSLSTSPDFKSGAFNHSTTPPSVGLGVSAKRDQLTRSVWTRAFAPQMERRRHSRRLREARSYSRESFRLTDARPASPSGADLI